MLPRVWRWDTTTRDVIVVLLGPPLPPAGLTRAEPIACNPQVIERTVVADSGPTEPETSF